MATVGAIGFSVVCHWLETQCCDGDLWWSWRERRVGRPRVWDEVWHYGAVSFLVCSTAAVSTFMASSINRLRRDNISFVLSRLVAAACYTASQPSTWSTNQLSACHTTPTWRHHSPTARITSYRQTSVTSLRSLAADCAEYRLPGSWPALLSSDWSIDFHRRLYQLRHGVSVLLVARWTAVIVWSFTDR